MNLASPNNRDISDVGIAISSFDKAWGSVDPVGKYKEAADPKQLWMMVPISRNTINGIFKNCVAKEYLNLYEQLQSTEEGVLHIRAYKYKSGLFSKAWFAKSSIVMGESDVPCGFISDKFQPGIWYKIKSIINLDGEFCETIEETLSIKFEVRQG